jgi:hypothetical protein
MHSMLVLPRNNQECVVQELCSSNTTWTRLQIVSLGCSLSVHRWHDFLCGPWELSVLLAWFEIGGGESYE